MGMRLGDILVRQGVLNSKQVEEALGAQERTGVPFGLACEELFGTDPRLIEQAWASQYAGLTQTVCLAEEQVEPAAQSVLSRRQAWQFAAVPLRWDGSELMVATTSDLLVRAHRFVSAEVKAPVVFVMTSRSDLKQALCRWYPLPGASLPGSPAQRNAA